MNYRAWLLALAGLLAASSTTAQVYNYFPPPGTTYAASGAFATGTPTGFMAVSGLRSFTTLTFGPPTGAGSRPNGFSIDPTTTDFMWCAGAGTLTFSTGATCTGAIGLDMEGSNDFELAGNNSPVLTVRDNGGAASGGSRNGVGDSGGSPGVALGINSPAATSCFTFGGSTYPLTTGITQCNSIDTINGLPLVMGLNGGVTVAVFNFTHDFLAVGSPTPLKYIDATNTAGLVATNVGDNTAGASVTNILGGTPANTQANGLPILTGLSATSASIGGGALAAGACASTATTVTGATTSMAVVVTPNTYPGDSAFWKAYVSGANTVTVLICESVAGTPTASTYKIRVML